MAESFNFKVVVAEVENARGTGIFVGGGNMKGWHSRCLSGGRGHEAWGSPGLVGPGLTTHLLIPHVG